MSDVQNERILARQTATVREMNMDELKLVAGGGNSTGGWRCDMGWEQTFWQMCLGSGDDYYWNPCDMTVDQYD